MSNSSVNQIAQDLLELSRKLELVRSNSKNNSLVERPDSAGSVISQSVSQRPEVVRSESNATANKSRSTRSRSSAARSNLPAESAVSARYI